MLKLMRTVKGHHQCRAGFTLIEALAIVAMIAIVVAVIYPPIMKNKRKQVATTCASNLKQTALGLNLYVQDYDECYPLVEVNDTGFTKGAPYYRPYGWADAIQPYIKNISIYHCPLVSSQVVTDPSSSGYTDYWYNGNLSSARMEQLNYSSTIVLLGEGNDGKDITDARYTKFSMPPNWITDTNSPAWRHCRNCAFNGSTLYAFIDCHVESAFPARSVAKSGIYITFVEADVPKKTACR